MRGARGSGVERSLAHRYLTQTSHHVSPEVIATDLQTQYRNDYGRRKRTAFRIQVENVLRAIGREDKEEADGLSPLEQRHMAKRFKESGAGCESSSSSSSSSSWDGADSVHEFPYPKVNLMNRSLMDLYRQGGSRPTGSVEGAVARGDAMAVEERPSTSTRPPLMQAVEEQPPSSTGSVAAQCQQPKARFVIPVAGEQTASSSSEHGHNRKDARPEERNTRATKNERAVAAVPAPGLAPGSASTPKHGGTGQRSLWRDPVQGQAMANNNKKLKSNSKKNLKPKSTQDGDVDEEIKQTLLEKSGFARLQTSTLKFADVGGNESMLLELCKQLMHMRHGEVWTHLGVSPPRGILLHGPPGCGKTLLAQAIAGELDVPLIQVAGPEVVSGVSGESEQKLRELFQVASESAPCVLFLDEIDAITPKREMASKDMERRLVAQLLTCMDGLHGGGAVLCIGATNRPDALDPALRRAGRFDREICLGIPDENARERILLVLCRGLRLKEEFNFKRLARLTPGYVGADLMSLCREAAASAVNRALHAIDGNLGGSIDNGGEDMAPTQNPAVEPDPAKAQGLETLRNQLPFAKRRAISDEASELERALRWLRDPSPLPPEVLHSLFLETCDFEVALSCVQPSAKREGFATVPDVTWDDIGALEAIREELSLAILAPIRHPEMFQVLGLTSPAGILLAGPPGCGKTMLAKAIANESGLNFISVKGPELLNMYVGESERAVRQVFQRARNSAPCVIFFDEIDAICPRRSDHESGASVRVVNQLLTEMDGLEARKQVFIMAATNRPDILDRAVLRPGRLDKTLYVGLPVMAERAAILRTLTRGGTKPPLEKDVDLNVIAGDGRSDGFSGADLQALTREAAIGALRRHLMAGVKADTDIIVSRKDFDYAFEKVKPSVSKQDREVYEQLKKSLVNV
ncbi:nuclear valosin-containing protein-like isoform X2 [Petromyzon marinus]|uniref:Nuclear valosin-containing protein-like isoform X2 n=1 Tax=Petromyzon marinus TaxID=7757 RepID=A0AAJ7TNI3_PETMA|nr:nuclear valosin-containing protein-like isoform X2 [Petromyzon marinus]